MSLSIASLNSGSNGNCYYVGNREEAVLIDAGLSCRETERRMARLGLRMNKVKAIFISHEHTDHIAGLAVLSRKFALPVYMTEAMIPHVARHIDSAWVREFKSNDEVTTGALRVKAFSKVHDACDPHSFVVQHDGVRVGVFTDLGRVCDNLIFHFRQCHAAFLEANYDAGMLASGPYPYHLKKRISGGKGHLSNAEALELFKAHRPPFMSHLLLSHLSKENNDPALVNALFQPYGHELHIEVASRYHESAVYQITAGGSQVLPHPGAEPVQMSLF